MAGAIKKIMDLVGRYGFRNLLKDKRLRPHTLIKGYLIISKSHIFDSRYYKEKYGVPTLIAPLHYYLLAFVSENNPCPAFSTKSFIADNREITVSKTNPILFYEKNKKSIGEYHRGLGNCPLYHYFMLRFLFDCEWYRETYLKGVKESEVNPIEHYAEIGWKEGNLPYKNFDIDRFRSENPSVDVSPVEFILKNRLSDGYFKGTLTIAQRIYNSIHDRYSQSENFPLEHPNSFQCKKIILFLMTPDDVISGGLMSISGIYELFKTISKDLYDDVVAVTIPWRGDTLYKYSLFESEMRIFRYEQLEVNYPNVEEMLIMLPEIYTGALFDYLKDNPDTYILRGKKNHLNIMNQNIDLMPFPFFVDRIKLFFSEVTQTVAHKKYCNQSFREIYNVPSHLVIPPIKKKVIVRPYEEKEKIFAYSFDTNPYKQRILDTVRKKYPEIKLIEIVGLKYPEYLELISKAKWVMSFGEGLDGYFTEPYYSGTISFAVWNDEFFTEPYRNLPTVFKTYDDAVERIISTMESLDNKERYEEVVKIVKDVHYEDYHMGKTSEEQLRSFLEKKYDYP